MDVPLPRRPVTLSVSTNHSIQPPLEVAAAQDTTYETKIAGLQITPQKSVHESFRKRFTL